MRTWILTVITALAVALGAPVTASAAFMHVISPGESLYSVAAADGLTVGDLAAANGLSPSAQLVAGTTIAIPPQTAGATIGAAPAATTGATTGMTGAATTGAATSSSEAEPDGDADDTAGAPVTTAGGYLVQPGDTLTAIAARYGVSMQQLAAINGLDPAGVLRYGTRISISGASSAAPAAPATTAGSATPVATTSAVTSSGTVQPTQEYVSPSTVGAIAAQNGVPASLAEAIGYQESGFNNAMVSSTGATGVMQIEPGTWNYIGANLAGPPPLQPASATDNIRAGTLYLRSLLNDTGGDPAMAAAAYYQGLQSVRQHGMYADTQQYVNNVMALRQRFGGP